MYTYQFDFASVAENAKALRQEICDLLSDAANEVFAGHNYHNFSYAPTESSERESIFSRISQWAATKDLALSVEDFKDTHLLQSDRSSCRFVLTAATPALEG